MTFVDSKKTLIRVADLGSSDIPILAQTAMRHQEVDLQAMVTSEVFQRLKKQLRKTTVMLGVAVAIYYFSIPALIAWAPGLLRLRIAAGISVGLLFVVSQYLSGGLVAYIFMRRTAAVDQMAAKLVRDMLPDTHEALHLVPVPSVIANFIHER